MISLRLTPSPALVVACVALLVALAGSGYAALRLPRNSVTTVQVKDFSLLARDFQRGQLPRGATGPAGDPGPTMGTVDGSAPAPPPAPDRLWENVEPNLPSPGKLFVTAHVERATLTCGGDGPCSVDLGLYVDDEPVAHTDRVLSSDCSLTPCRIHVPQQDLFGISASLATGAHRVQLCSRTRTGTISTYSTEGGEIGAILLGA